MHTPLWLLTVFRLNLTFIIALVTTNVSALVVGTILDRYGPRICGLIPLRLPFSGELVRWFCSRPTFRSLYCRSLLACLGGTFIFVPSFHLSSAFPPVQRLSTCPTPFHLSNAFPPVQGLILALIAGAFDTSAAVFLLFRLFYESTGGAFQPKQFFLVSLVMQVFIFVCQLTLMPANSYETRTELDNKAE